MKNRFLASIVLATFLLSVLNISGCKPEVIEDYPVPVVSDASDVSVQIDSTTMEDSDALEFDEEYFANLEIPSFRETGKYVYNPVKVPESFKDEFERNPKKKAFMKMLMESIYECKKEFYVPEEITISGNDINNLWFTMYEAGPITQSVEFVEIEDRHYEILYYPEWDESGVTQEVSMDFVYQQNQMYVDYLEDMLNSIIDPDDSDIEIARKVYNKLIEDYDILVMSAETDENGNIISAVYDEDVWAFENESGVDNHNTSMVEMLNQKKIVEMQLPWYYKFILTQLGIECYEVQASGKYQEQMIPTLDEHMESTMWSNWNIVVSEGKAYHCDIIFDYFLYQETKKEYPDLEPEDRFFGMSDETRKKSMEVNSGMWVSSFNGTTTAPKCEEDYK